MTRMRLAPDERDEIARRIAADADRCVKCGICLPHCPTYGLLRDEGDSPRGRIAIMQGLVGGGLDPSGAARAHLDRCLACRACEGACPSGVPYGRLIDDIRSWLHEDQGGRPRTNESLGPDIAGRLERPAARRRLFRLARLYQWTGAQWLLRRSGLLALTPWRRLDALLPRLGARFTDQGVLAARGEVRGRVGLFTGCLGRDLDARALRAAGELLRHAGYEVVIPKGQGCCGALARHAGRMAEARRLAVANLEAFADPAITAVVGIASGCNAMLAETEALTGRVLPIVDIARFLDKQATLPSLAPLDREIVIHTPCTQRLDRDAVAATRRLLEAIPGARISELAPTGCCGAAGRYVVDEPVIADRLRDGICAALDGHDDALLASSNLGCTIHLMAGLRRRHPGIEVRHPVEILARQAALAGGSGPLGPSGRT